MPPKKGLCQDEKLSKLLDWFHGSHSFYTLKEIEQKASKACRVPSMQIKELVASLVNDNLVEQEKCGVTNLYWSFQYSEHKRNLQRYAQLQQSNIKLQSEKDKLFAQVVNAVSERHDMDNSERKARVSRCMELAQTVTTLGEEVDLSKQTESIEILKQGIEFFNELIESVLSYLSHQSGASVSVLKKELAIPIVLDEAPAMNDNKEYSQLLC